LSRETRILTRDDMGRITKRIAHEIIERNEVLSDLLFVGLQRRGVPLARKLSDSIESFTGVTVPVGSLDINFYRDDLIQRPHPFLHPTELPVTLEGKITILVDDVFYTGRTSRSALNALIDLGRPRLIQLAVMVDRGHRELPIRPDYVGKNIPTSQNQSIQVRVDEYDGTDEVVLIDDAHLEPALI